MLSVSKSYVRIKYNNRKNPIVCEALNPKAFRKKLNIILILLIFKLLTAMNAHVTVISVNLNNNNDY